MECKCDWDNFNVAIEMRIAAVYCRSKLLDLVNAIEGQNELNTILLSFSFASPTSCLMVTFNASYTDTNSSYGRIKAMLKLLCAASEFLNIRF